MQVAAAMVDELDVETIENAAPLDDGSEVFMRVSQILPGTIFRFSSRLRSRQAWFRIRGGLYAPRVRYRCLRAINIEKLFKLCSVSI